MKLMIKWFMTVSLGFALAACGATGDPDDTGEFAENNIVDVATREGFSEFVQALENAELDDDFKFEGGGPYTLFVPTNAAFNAADPGSIESGDLLEYHILQGRFTLEELTSGSFETSSGLLLEVAVEGDTISLNGEANVITPNNLQASNGVVHAIDSVLTPPDEPEEDGGEEGEDPEEPATSFTAELGAIVVDVESEGTGTASATLEEGDVLSVTGSVQGLTGEITGVALYEGGGDDDGILLYDLEFDGATLSGNPELSPVDVQILRDDNMYIGVSTAAYPEGEISGPLFSEE